MNDASRVMWVSGAPILLSLLASAALVFYLTWPLNWLCSLLALTAGLALCERNPRYQHYNRALEDWHKTPNGKAPDRHMAAILIVLFAGLAVVGSGQPTPLFGPLYLVGLAAMLIVMAAMFLDPPVKRYMRAMREFDAAYHYVPEREAT